MPESITYIVPTNVHASNKHAPHAPTGVAYLPYPASARLRTRPPRRHTARVDVGSTTHASPFAKRRCSSKGSLGGACRSGPIAQTMLASTTRSGSSHSSPRSAAAHPPAAHPPACLPRAPPALAPGLHHTPAALPRMSLAHHVPPQHQQQRLRGDQGGRAGGGGTFGHRLGCG